MKFIHRCGLSSVGSTKEGKRKPSIAVAVTTSSKVPKISIGIGSWTDAEYKGLLYPKGLPDAERLKVYAEWFSHVEVNSTYYAAPGRSKVDNWIKLTPHSFIFDIKLHEDFSMRPGHAVRSGLAQRFLDDVAPMAAAGKFGVFLLLFPPKFSPKDDKLEQFDPVIEKLSPHIIAAELRHTAWLEGEQRQATLDFFRRRKLTLVGVDMPRLTNPRILPPIDEVTNPRVAYLRLHGRNPDWLKVKKQEERHTHEYSPEELAEIATRVRSLAAQVDQVRVVANNHARDYAPKAALGLQRQLGLERKRATAAETSPADF